MGTDANRRRRIHAHLAAVIVITLLGAGCGGFGEDQTAGSLVATSPNRQSPKPGGRLVVSVPADTNGWNPFIDQWSDSGTLIGSSFIETLAVQDNDGRAQPWLAEKWDPNAAFTEWTLTLRSGVSFHDGTPFDAIAAKKSLEASFKSGLYQVALGPLYDRVEIVDPRRVKVFLKAPWAQYPTSLANQFVLAPAMIDRLDGGVLNPIGTGPFKFDSWLQNKKVVVKRYDRYWRRDAENRQLPYLNDIEFRPIIDDIEREQALRSGQIDFALNAASDIAYNLADDFNVLKDYSSQRTYLMLNTAEGAGNRPNPLTNVHARRALAYATDRQRIATGVGRDVQVTTFGYRPTSPWVPQGTDGYFPFDPAQARSELEKYRRDTGKATLEFTITGITAPECQEVLLALKAMWDELGIKVRIDSHEPAKLTVLTALGQYHATWFRLHDFPDPDQMYFYLTSDNVHNVGELSLNFTHYTSKRLDDNLRIVRGSTDQKARKVANDDIIRETNDQVINLWLYDTPASLIVQKYVQGLDGFRSHGFMNNLPKPWLGDVWLGR
jgi:peptide/nickel transport system substrate-binding protein